MSRDQSDDRRCLTCVFFEESASAQHDLGKGAGECHRLPPLVFADKNAIRDHRVVFPGVRPGSWCGEWRPGKDE